MDEIDVPPDACTSPAAVIAHLVEHLGGGGRLGRATAAQVCQRVVRREQLGATAEGGGLARTNATVPAVGRLAVVWGRCAARVPWPNPVGEAGVRRVCLIVAPNDAVKLRALEQVLQTQYGRDDGPPGR